MCWLQMSMEIQSCTVSPIYTYEGSAKRLQNYLETSTQWLTPSLLSYYPKPISRKDQNILLCKNRY